MYKIVVCNSIDSTQIKLIELVKGNLAYDKFILLALNQTNSIGSYGKTWLSVYNNSNFKSIKKVNITSNSNELECIYFGNLLELDQQLRGNLYFSFCTDKMPLDLPKQSISIYYSVLASMVLRLKNSSVFVKWPNDLYIGDKKVGGVLCSNTKNKIICGIGINLIEAPHDFAIADVEIEIQEFLFSFFKIVDENISWKKVFEIFKNDFLLNKDLKFNLDGKQYLLKNAILCEDGSILINNQRIYGIR